MPGGYIFVDGDSVGDVGWPVVNDRERLAQSGIFVAVITTNGKGDVIGKPHIISRGFVSRSEEENLLDGAEETIAYEVHKHGNSREPLNGKLEKALMRYLYAETGRRPLTHVIIK